MDISIQGPSFNMATLCEPILRSLPDWFAIEEATSRYIKEIDDLPTLVAFVGGEPVGFLTLRHHSQYAAEIHVMGVRPELHRRGVGRSLVAEAEKVLRRRGVEYLQVKTLGPSHPDGCYARTRSFFFALGFRPLEESIAVWGSENPCLQMVKSLVATTPAAQQLAATDPASVRQMGAFLPGELP